MPRSRQVLPEIVTDGTLSETCRKSTSSHPQDLAGEWRNDDAEQQDTPRCTGPPRRVHPQPHRRIVDAALATSGVRGCWCGCGVAAAGGLQGSADVGAAAGWAAAGGIK